MGMSEEDHAYLSTEIDFIIHAAAYVNLIYPYQVPYVYTKDLLETFQHVHFYV